MPTALDQPANAASPVNMSWVNPPPDVTNTIQLLRHYCEAWPKTPTNNPLHLVSGMADAVCQAVTGHALFVPEDLGMSIVQIGTFALAMFIVVLIAVAGFVTAVFWLWRKFFGPPRPPKPLPDQLSAVVVLIGWLGWLSAAGLVARYSPPYSLGLTTVFMLAAAMWVLLVPHLVSLLRGNRV